MEYVPIPTDPALPPVQITLRNPERHWYQGTWEEHRSGTYWAQFPKRYGYEHGEFWSHDEQANKGWGDPNFHRWIMSQPRQELEDIAIAWLFFGTLAEVTHCFLDKKEHLQATKGGSYSVRLTSASMDRFLGRWHNIITHFKGVDFLRGSTLADEAVGYEGDPRASYVERSSLPVFRPGVRMDIIEAKLSAQGRSIPYERAFRCLQRSRAIIGLICQAIDTKIVFVVATLHEFLATAMKSLVFRGEVADAYAKEKGYHLGQWIEGADFTHYNREALHSLRWCPRTENVLWTSKNRTLALDHFAINLKTHQSKEDHSSCSEDICTAYQLDPEAYTIPHVDMEPTACKCAQLELDPDIASAILASDPESFPIINVTKLDDSDESTTFVESFDSSEVGDYVAISHVWSHGLGNPKQNALPKCQLQRIQKLVDDLAPRAGIKGTATPFWMDTLCCPLQPKESRRAAILKMAKTYDRATCVLVLDRNLYSVNAKELSNLEILMHIFRTTWMQRLWTLQEAKLAKHVWFQFHDGPISVERVLDVLLEDSDSITQILFRKQFLPALHARYQGLRERYHETSRALDMPLTNSCYRLISLAFSLNGRSTSWASDEAICIVNILGLDLEPILAISTDDPSCAALRMREMWKQWTAVPLAIIFNRAPRLPYKGFRWAHSTFVRTRKWAVPLVEVDHDARIDPEGRGLLVTPSSFVLRNTIPLTMIEQNIKLEREVDSKWEKTAGTKGLESFATFLIVDCVSGGWYDVRVVGPVHDSMPEFDRDDELAITYSDDRNESNASDRQTCGLLVSLHDRDTSRGILYATSLYHVRLARQETANEKLLNAGLQVRQILQETPALRGDVRDGTVVTSPAYNPSDRDTQLGMAKANSIARTVLGDADVRSYLMTTMTKNQDPSTLAWRTATEMQRQDWNFRVDHGDVGFFYNQIVNVWLNVAFTPAMPFPRGLLTYCID